MLTALVFVTAIFLLSFGFKMTIYEKGFRHLFLFTVYKLLPIVLGFIWLYIGLEMVNIETFATFVSNGE